MWFILGHPEFTASRYHVERSSVIFLSKYVSFYFKFFLSETKIKIKNIFVLLIVL